MQLLSKTMEHFLLFLIVNFQVSRDPGGKKIVQKLLPKCFRLYF